MLSVRLTTQFRQEEGYGRGRVWKRKVLKRKGTEEEGYTGFEINARPLARGDWKPWGMSRIFAQVVRRASGYFNLFCQLCVTMNETNY